MGKGMQLHPKQWKKIAEMVKTRTVVQVRTHAQKCWNENMSKQPIDINVTNLGLDDLPSNLESPRKKRKSVNKNRHISDFDRVLIEEQRLAHAPPPLDMPQLLTEDALLPDDLLKININYGNSPTFDSDPSNSPLDYGKKLSQDLSTLALSPHLAANSFLCNAPEHWEHDNTSMSPKITKAEIRDYRQLKECF